MPSFPALSCGSTALYPLTESREYRTQVIRFANDTEQAWNDRGSLRRFRLTLADVSGEDVSRVREFFRSVIGQRDSWDIALGGTTVSNLVFESDDFPAVVTTGNTASVDLAVRQVQV